MTTPTESTRTAPYEIFILVLSLFALAALVAPRVTSLSSEQAQLLEWFDLAVCGVFFADFVYLLARAPDRWRYLRTWGWLDLLSALPASEAFRWARSPRIVRIVRLLRSLRAARLLFRSLASRRAESSLMTAGLLGLAVLVLASVAILQVEQGAESNIRSAEDALWWSVSTMTTVGYGDRYPVTPEGRLVGAVLMVVGVSLFGVFTAFLASRFMKSEEARSNRRLGEELERQMSEIRREIAELRGAIEKGREGR